jgi:hypothetical protein
MSRFTLCSDCRHIILTLVIRSYLNKLKLYLTRTHSLKTSYNFYIIVRKDFYPLHAQLRSIQMAYSSLTYKKGNFTIINTVDLSIL